MIIQLPGIGNPFAVGRPYRVQQPLGMGVGIGIHQHRLLFLKVNIVYIEVLVGIEQLFTIG